ncbi:MAG: glutaredoxin family protein [Planctomycetota bacterium]|jgi:thioredoxin-like negative regulator of GroEL
MKVVLYGKPACCLCDVVESRLEVLRERGEFDLVKVNILEDPALEERFGTTIPAVEVDGRLVSEGKFNENAVAEALGVAPKRKWFRKRP